MDREEFKRRLDDISRRESELRNERWKLEEQYIRESDASKFKYGEKVLLHKGSMTYEAIVRGYLIDDYWHDVVLKLVMCKKDGSPSRCRLNYYPAGGDWVEKIK